VLLGTDIHEQLLTLSASLFHKTMDATVLGDPTADSSNNNEEASDDDSNRPMTWEDESVEDLIENLCQDMRLYTWWAENFWPRVVGLEKWKLHVGSGNKKPSDVVTVSDEALALLLFENHFQSWKAKADSNDTGSQTSSITSDDSSTKYTRKNGSTKDGWSDHGITRFQQLMAKVTEDRASTNGAEFDKLVQQKMQQESSNARSRKKRRRETDENRITMVVNELPDMPDSDSDEE
jgi:hypothetical protein